MITITKKEEALQRILDKITDDTILQNKMMPRMSTQCFSL